MSRFQHGSLFKVKRKTSPDVWVFRWYDDRSGKRIRRKQIVGDVIKLRNRGDAESAVTALRSAINVGIGIPPRKICDLAAHYRLHELTRERKAFSTIDVHWGLIKRYIEPPWGYSHICDVKTAIRYFLCWKNSLKNVRGRWGRAVPSSPRTLEVALWRFRSPSSKEYSSLLLL